MNHVTLLLRHTNRLFEVNGSIYGLFDVVSTFLVYVVTQWDTFDAFSHCHKNFSKALR